MWQRVPGRATEKPFERDCGHLVSVLSYPSTGLLTFMGGRQHSAVIGSPVFMLQSPRGALKQTTMSGPHAQEILINCSWDRDWV